MLGRPQSVRYARSLCRVDAHPPRWRAGSQAGALNRSFVALALVDERCVDIVV
jgi:hypothetical protein